jgi:hypothetical protein
LVHFTTQVGIRGTWRSLDQNSPRYSSQPLPFATSPTLSPVGFGNGNEWEIRTYILMLENKIYKKMKNRKFIYLKTASF